MKNSFYRNEPREISAKFTSVCKETGKPIKKGDLCLYYPKDRTIYHLDSKQAQAYREARYDEEILNNY